MSYLNNNPKLHDPLTVAISFMPNPGPFRAGSKFTASCWTHALYLEGVLTCPTARWIAHAPPPPNANPRGKRKKGAKAALPTHESELPQQQQQQQHKQQEEKNDESTCSIDDCCSFAPILRAQLPKTLTRGAGFYHLLWANDPTVTGIDQKVDLPSNCRLRHVSLKDLPNLVSLREEGTWTGKNNYMHSLKDLHDQHGRKGKFLSNHHLRSVTLQGLPQLINLEHRLLYGCNSLTTVTISDLGVLKSLQKSFLAACRNLQHVTLENLPRLQLIEDDSFAACPELQALTLVDLPCLEAIGDNVLSTSGEWSSRSNANFPKHMYKGGEGCCCQQVLLARLPALTSIGRNFSSGRNIGHLKLEGLPKLEIVGENFLHDARGAKDLAICDLPSLTQLDTCFLAFFTNTTGKSREAESHHEPLRESVVSFERLTQLKTVGDGWMQECPSFTLVIFQELPELTRVGQRWLHMCTSLVSVSFDGVLNFPKLRTVARQWLSGCTSLRSAMFKHLPLWSVAHDWLSECESLTELTFQNLHTLTEVGDTWMAKCKALTTVKSFEPPTGAFPMLKTVGDFWLYDCHALREIAFVSLPELSEVGDYWLGRCRSLEIVTFARLPKLRLWNRAKKETQLNEGDTTGAE